LEKRRKLKSFSVRAIAPNAVTLLAFCAGLTSIRFALADKWELALAAIMLAAVFDGLDGTVARLLRSTSKFGAELDSLSDVVAFGVVPALLIYQWGLYSLDRLGWAACLIYAIAMILRLARFNARMDEDDGPRKKMGYLTGVPAPMGAGLLLAPIMLDVGYTGNLTQQYPLILAGYTVFIGLLIVSTLPTISMKFVKVPRDSFVMTLLIIGIIFALLFVYTWGVLLMVGLFYLISIPWCYIVYRRRLKVDNF